MATGISDVHMMILTSMRANYERLKPIQIRYRSYKHFREDLFLSDLRMMPFHKCTEIDDKEKAYEVFKDMFLTVVNRHAPLKTKTIRGTQAPFKNKELSSAIMHRSKMRNVYDKTKSIEAWEAFKKQRNTCVSIKRKNIRNHFARLTEGNFLGSRDFWGAIKPFLSSKSVPKSQKIILNENETLINDSFEVTNIMNNYFVNVVENATGKSHAN